MLWMEFECETSLVAKTAETLQHFFCFLPDFLFYLLFWDSILGRNALFT